MRCFVLFALTLAGAVLLSADASAFGRKKNNAACCPTPVATSCCGGYGGYYGGGYGGYGGSYGGYRGYGYGYGTSVMPTYATGYTPAYGTGYPVASGSCCGGTGIVNAGYQPGYAGGQVMTTGFYGVNPVNPGVYNTITPTGGIVVPTTMPR